MSDMAEESAYDNVPQKARRSKNKEFESEDSPQRRWKLRVVLLLLMLLFLAAIVTKIILCRYMRAQTDALTGATISTPMTTTTHGTTTTASPSTAPCKLVCDTDWELQEKRCFHFSTNKLTWEQSREDCESKSGRLVKIFGKNKQKFLFDKVTSLMEKDEDKFWIGLTDSAEEGQWRWTDNTLLNSSSQFWFKSKNGDKTEPDNWNGTNPEGEDCVRMGEKYSTFEKYCWFDKDCNTLQKYICEKKSTCEKHRT